MTTIDADHMASVLANTKAVIKFSLIDFSKKRGLYKCLISFIMSSYVTVFIKLNLLSQRNDID